MERAIIATTEHIKMKEERAAATPVGPEALQQAQIQPTPVAHPVVLDMLNRVEDRATATDNVGQARTRQEAPLHARIATTANTKTKEGKAHANRAGLESFQQMTITANPDALLALLDTFKPSQNRTTATESVGRGSIR